MPNFDEIFENLFPLVKFDEIALTFAKNGANVLKICEIWDDVLIL